VSCFVSSLDQESASIPRLTSEFPQAATLVVQMQRAPVRPVAECEAVIRLHTSPKQPLQYLDPEEGGPAVKGYSQIALVGAAKLVFTGAQLGFGTQENDIKLVFERLGRVLATFQSGFDRIAVSSLYLTNASLAAKIRDVRSRFYLGNAPASTLLPFEGLPSIDASFAADLIALTP
jgi:enamine deaminase RidA (YjgF/YER057c/UK114 family)